MATGNLKNFRVDDEVWLPAGERAKTEGTNLSALIRQWLADYAETGSPVADGKRAKVRLTAAEQREAVAAISDQIVADRILDTALLAINQGR